LNAVSTYYYRLRAYSSCGVSTNSATITVATLQTPPAAPVANEATSVLQLTFAANWSSSATATGYRLDVSPDPDFTAFVTGYTDKDVGNVTTLNVTGLSAGTTYYYRARAYNSGGSSPNSNVISVTTLFYAPVSPSIDPVSGILQTSFTLTWNRVATAAGYRLDVAINNGFTTFLPGYNDKDVGNITTADITGLSAKTTYYCRLRAYNSGGVSPNSNTKTVITMTIPPPVPSGLTSSSCSDKVTLKWRKNTGADFLRYRIYGGTTTNPTTKIDSSSASSSDTTKIISGLLRGQSYYFRITAVNYDGVQSDFSEQSNATVKSGVIPKVKIKWNDVLVCYNLGDSVKSYQWFTGNAAISGETGQYFQTNKRSGVYHVEIIDLFGCKNSSAPVPLSGTKYISVYPNPSTGNFALKLNELPDGPARVTILNSAGLIVLEFETELTDNMLYKEIHLNNIDVGIYLVKVLSNNDLYYSRIVIAR
jgi:predicted phage tail protein